MPSLRTRPDRAPRALAFLLLPVLGLGGLTGCGDTSTDPDTSSSSPSPSHSQSAAPTRSAPDTFAAAPYASVEDLFAALDGAIGAHTSVHVEIGNLTPPPPVVIDQQYGAGGTDMRYVFDMGPPQGQAGEWELSEAEAAELVKVAYRIDGLYYAEGQDALTEAEAYPDHTDPGGQKGMWWSDVRTDFRRLAAVGADLVLVGEEDVAGVPTRHYRLTATFAPPAPLNPTMVPEAVRGAKRVDLWLATDDLPVRLDIDVGPLESADERATVPPAERVGLSRTEYSRWSEPLDFDPDDLDFTWDRDR